MVIIKSPKIKLVYVSVAGSKENLHKHIIKWKPKNNQIKQQKIYWEILIIFDEGHKKKHTHSHHQILNKKMKMTKSLVECKSESLMVYFN